MAYSELVKNFAKIREYMSQFYIYGFKSRNEYSSKSARSYDNERRRIESWLGDYMQFYQNANGKSTFIAVDSRAVSHNPLYKAFKAKSFTDKDIMLHFYMLDILANGSEKSLKEIADSIAADYLSSFSNYQIDESTVRKKLKEYEKLGIITSKKDGKELIFRKSADAIRLEDFKDVVSFYSEEDPIGVVGSYILDKYGTVKDNFSFKHHYIFRALESEILYDIFNAINGRKYAELDMYSFKKHESFKATVLPLKVYISTENGRRYLMAYCYRTSGIQFYRIDAIKKIELKEQDADFEKHIATAEQMKNRIWGVSTSKKRRIDHIEMCVYVGSNEQFIVNRLEREKRCGRIMQVDDTHYKFVADVYDAAEVLPWIKTFIGRITSLACSDKAVEKQFYADVCELKKMYGGGDDDF